jgi:RNA polymerase sigma-70 factor (ECF subfamily)
MADAPPDDLQLLDAVRRGDDRALQIVFERHGAILSALGRRILGQQPDADDVLSEVLWDLWSNPDKFDPARANLRAYLVLKMRSRCLDRLRARKSAGRTVREQTFEPASDAPSAEEGVLQAERRELVRNALRSLGEPEKSLIELAFYDGYSHSEIARQTGAPLGTVKSRIRTGLIRLRDVLRTSSKEPSRT